MARTEQRQHRDEREPTVRCPVAIRGLASPAMAACPGYEPATVNFQGGPGSSIPPQPSCAHVESAANGAGGFMAACRHADASRVAAAARKLLRRGGTPPEPVAAPPPAAEDPPARNEPAEAALRLAEDIVDGMSPATVMDRLLGAIARAVKAGPVYVVRLGGDGTIVAGAFDDRDPVLSVGTVLPHGSIGLLDEAVRGRRPVTAASLMSHGLPADTTRCLAQIRSAVAIPLPAGDWPLGVVICGRREDIAFSDAEVLVLIQSVETVRVALLHAHRVEGAGEAQWRLAHAADIVAELAPTEEPAHVVRGLLERVVTSMEAVRASFARVEGAALVIETHIETEDIASMAGWRYTDFDESVQHALDTGEPTVARGYALELVPPAQREAVARVRHVANIPLTRGGRVLAILFCSRAIDRAFSEDEIGILRLVGHIALLAWRNARLRVEAEDAARAKASFINSAAHELGTPLAVISGYLDLLLGGAYGPPAPGWTSPLEVIVGRKEELKRLLEDLLFVLSIETGNVAVRAKTVDLLPAAQRAVARALQRQAEADVAVTGVTPPVSVHADPRLVATILDKLIDNAVSFSEGRPWVRIELERTDDRVMLRVRDRGVGIPAESHQEIFQPFQRLDDARVWHSSGGGVGLSVSRTLAEQQGGSLVLESSIPGEGSTFLLSLPAARPGRAGPSPRPLVSTSPLSGRRTSR